MAPLEAPAERSKVARSRPGKARSGLPGHALGRACTAALVAAVSATAAACDLPLALPRWTTAWTLTVVADTLGTGRFLPEGITEEDGVFVVDTVQVTNQVRIGDVCELCTCFAGPVPPLSLTPFEWPIPLPPGLTGASLTAGRVRLTLHNELGFDLLDNGRGGRGWLAIEIVDALSARVVDSLRYEGQLPPGDSVALTFDLAGLELHRAMVARVLGYTPGSSCAVRLDAASGIRADVRLEGVRARAVRVVVVDAAFALDPRSVALPDELTRRLRADEARGILEVEIQNTVGTALDLILSVAGRADSLFTGGAALYTPIPVPAGSPATPGRVHKRYVLDLDALHGAERIHVSARSRVVGDRRVRIGGGEGVIYRGLLHAELSLP
ncbi:MAG: hypothetical protein HY704_09005 [Gemmatimonadetes bacterium]|nr:hypothetical protein [Gemmatimonadota bacterium]